MCALLYIISTHLLLYHHCIRSSYFDHMVCVQIQVSAELYLLILHRCLCSVMVPLVADRESIFPCQAQMYLSGQLVMPSFVLCLGQLATFRYDVTYCLICLLAHSAQR